MVEGEGGRGRGEGLNLPYGGFLRVSCINLGLAITEGEM